MQSFLEKVNNAKSRKWRTGEGADLTWPQDHNLGQQVLRSQQPALGKLIEDQMAGRLGSLAIL